MEVWTTNSIKEQRFHKYSNECVKQCMVWAIKRSALFYKEESSVRGAIAVTLII